MKRRHSHFLIHTLSVVALLTAAAPWAALPASIIVDTTRPGAKISPMLWGIFFEDINHSTDGGIYPELVRNRSFEDSDKPDSWRLVNAPDGQSEMTVDSSRPLNPFNRRSLRLKLSGTACLINESYWGMNIGKGASYTFKVAARASDGFSGPLTVQLQGKANPKLAAGEITELTSDWKYQTVTLTATDGDPQALLNISATGTGTVWLDMVSLMPKQTWKGHGLRPDLCEMLAALKPSFVRFPGGCWVEGDDLAHMYHWKKTIGDVSQREPLWNIWQYWATHGLGFHEYLQLSEDLGAEPLFCINAGMSHKEVVPLDQMGQWVQDALDAIEYANGPVDSVWGGLRAKNGHPAPFNLKYIEIGNENGGPAYAERWALFHKAIKAKHPGIQLVVNHWQGGYPQQPPADIVDEHYYNDPEFFMREATKYDGYDRNGPRTFVGEYAVTSGAGLGNLRGAIGEAAFMTGLERNGDIVVIASYAPLFCNANHKRWPINLINFDSARAFGLPSYYVQRLFSEHRGDTVLPVTVDTPFVEDATKGGAIGVGTWLTQAEFKDIKVARGGETLFACDFADGTKGWKLLGGGEWKAEGGVLRQSSNKENVRAITGDKDWADYTYSLKARKLGGAEGFLILFRVQKDNAKAWWNLGGWGNTQHGIELGGIVTQTPGRIEPGRWYDIRIELKGSNIECYLDGKLVHEVSHPTVKALYASASRAKASGEVILKAVNAAATPVTADVTLQGVVRLNGPARVIVLTSDKPEDENTLDEPTKVVPKPATVNVSGPSFRHEFPGNSLTVLRLHPTN